jgi:hypothetical protein
LSKHSPDFSALNGRIVIEATENRGRPKGPYEAQTNAQRQATHRAKKHELRLERVAILDFETDPFDDGTFDNEAERIEPFTACLYNPSFEPVIIWDNNFDSFIDKVLAAIEALPDEGWTIYAHNGGKFDYLFLISRLRGQMAFKGRGLMSAKIGTHEIRDSFHIIPEKLAAFHKDEFDYKKMVRSKREKHREEIIRYMVSDCVYLYEMVHGFLSRFGFKISVGQAALGELKKFHEVGKIGKLADATLREYFFGGRVECLRGAGHWIARPGKSFKLIDRNSMYPAEMAKTMHPISANYTKIVGKGITPKTAFIDLSCYNHGALVRKNENNETSAPYEYGRYKTTIHEYKAALELGLIERVTIHSVIECDTWGNFAEVVNAFYAEKEQWKAALDKFKAAGDTSSVDYWYAKRQYMFTKYILNNMYGKFAQNPARYKETVVTDPGAPAPEGYEDQLAPVWENDQYAIWERPAPRSIYNNVGTAASITGAARADLLRTIYHCTNAIYCDTDSVICEEYDSNAIDIHPSKLGAWDLEAEFSEVVIVGKKLYACKPKDFKVGQEAKIKVKSKGVSGLTWDEMVRLLAGETIAKRNPAPTMTRRGDQLYMVRSVKRTAPLAGELKRPAGRRKEMA